MLAALTKFGLAVAAVVLLPAIAQAQGLGQLTVHSARGEPLRAEVAIVSTLAGKQAGLHGSIATPDLYKELGVEFDPLLFSVRASVEDRRSGPILLLTSSRPMRELFLNVVVVLQYANGRVVRNYPILFDSP